MNYRRETIKVFFIGPEGEGREDACRYVFNESADTNTNSQASVKPVTEIIETIDLTQFKDDITFNVQYQSTEPNSLCRLQKINQQKEVSHKKCIYVLVYDATNQSSEDIMVKMQKQLAENCTDCTIISCFTKEPKDSALEELKTSIVNHVKSIVEARGIEITACVQREKTTKSSLQNKFNDKVKKLLQLNPKDNDLLIYTDLLKDALDSQDTNKYLNDNETTFKFYHSKLQYKFKSSLNTIVNLFSAIVVETFGKGILASLQKCGFCKEKSASSLYWRFGEKQKAEELTEEIKNSFKPQ